MVLRSGDARDHVRRVVLYEIGHGMRTACCSTTAGITNSNNTQIDLDSQLMTLCPKAARSAIAQGANKTAASVNDDFGDSGESQGLLGLAVAPGGGEYELALKQDSRCVFQPQMLAAR
jgi:hypothetical protein